MTDMWIVPIYMLVVLAICLLFGLWIWWYQNTPPQPEIPEYDPDFHEPVKRFRDEP